MSDLLTQLLAAPNAQAAAAVLDGWPPDAIDESELAAIKAKAAEVLRVDVQKSLALAELMLRAAARTGDPAHRALGLISLANAYSLGGLGRDAQAVAVYDEAAAIYRAAGRRVDEANAQIAKILALSNLGRHDEALAAGRWASEVLAENREWLRLGKLRANLGNLYFRMGEEVEALAMFDQARETYALLPDDLAARQALGRLEHNRSAVLRDLGRFAEAIGTAQAALVILRETGQTAEIARCNLNLAITYYILGRYNDALSLLAQSRSFFAADGRQRDAVLVGIYTGQCLLQLRRYEEVLALAREASDEFERSGEQFYVAQAELNEATACAGLARYEQALAVLARARGRFEAIVNPMWAALTDLETADVLRRLGRSEESLDLAMRCAHTFGAGDLPVEQAQANLSAAHAALASGRDLEAARLVAEAERLGSSQDLPSLLYPCHHLYARLAERRGDASAALAHVETAIRELERLRGHLMIEHRVEFLEDKGEIYEDGVALALALGDQEAALTFAERARSAPSSRCSTTGCRSACGPAARKTSPTWTNCCACAESGTRCIGAPSASVSWRCTAGRPPARNSARSRPRLWPSSSGSPGCGANCSSAARITPPRRASGAPASRPCRWVSQPARLQSSTPWPVASCWRSSFPAATSAAFPLP